MFYDSFCYARKTLNFLQLHRSQDAELKMTREGNKPLASIYEESENCFDIDLCAADTVDYGQGNCFSFSVYIYISSMIVQLLISTFSDQHLYHLSYSLIHETSIIRRNN